MPHHEYKTEEDPKLFQSTKTQRGPLSDNWIEEYKKQVFPIMCAYKLCKVEFRYWGMQSKIERFIHDTGEHRAHPMLGGQWPGYPTLLSPVTCLSASSLCMSAWESAFLLFWEGDTKAHVQLPHYPATMCYLGHP